MKQLLYFIALLIFIVVLGSVLNNISSSNATMSMPQMVSVSILLVLYTIAISLVGEQPSEDEREQYHKYIANRTALLAGTGLIVLVILYQLFTHQFDYWLLVPLIGINFTKIISLLYLHYKK